MQGVRIAGLALVGIVAGTGLVLAAAASAWSRRTARIVRRLTRDARQASAPPAPLTLPAGIGIDIPSPVRRFLQRGRVDAGPRIRNAELRQTGEILLREPDGWAPFTATETFAAHPPGFLWDARVRIFPLLDVRVHDSYLDGAGSMRGAVAGVVPVVEAAGTPEMSEAALQRYLAEAPWLPTRLRPASDLVWRPLDEVSAIATLTDSHRDVSARFQFDDGDIVGVHVAARPRSVNGRQEPTPWVGRFGDHREIDGVRIPTSAEVAWVIDGEERPYWRGRIVSALWERG